MKKALGLLGLVALVLSVFTTVSLASGLNDPIAQPRPNVSLGELYDRSVALAIPPDSQAPIPMPEPLRGMTLQAAAGSDTSVGPMASGRSDISLRLGGVPALVTPRGGGAMSSPKQIADREIRRLIRRLN